MTRRWISAVWRSGSRAAMRSPTDFRQRILASILLRAWFRSSVSGMPFHTALLQNSAGVRIHIANPCG
ncbi:hypothetical protein A6024_16360 [Rhodovulum sulfidophilum]|nr:hypothetical protein A6W98_16505 [Rhodovulum sulfidophilum DSM 1374]ANB39346.1 hypothetical protein A6024_16360 [Rhodovulum sulfidophilum]